MLEATALVKFSNDATPRLTAMKGNIFKLDEIQFDAAVAFVRTGYTCIFGDFMAEREYLERSKIGYVIYLSSVVRNMPCYSYQAYFKNFTNEQEITDYVKQKIFESLDLALECGPRIAFHGLQIHGWDEPRNEKMSISVVGQWLNVHPEASVTMVDIRGSFGKYMAIK